MTQDDDTKQDIGDGESEGESVDTGESTALSDITEGHLDHKEEFLLLGQARCDNSLRTTWVPLPKKHHHANTVNARPLLPNSRTPPGSFAPPLPKCQKSALLNKSSKSDSAQSAQVLLQPLSREDQNAPQYKTSPEQNVPEYEQATFAVATTFMEAIVFTKTPWPILFDKKYAKLEEGW
jgi:hypothetical protein